MDLLIKSMYAGIVILGLFLAQFCSGQILSKEDHFVSRNIQGPSMVAPVRFNQRKTLGWILRLEPTFFYKTLSLQVEKMFSNRVSFGANLHLKQGSNNSRMVNGINIVDHFNKSGYLLELATKYYLNAEEPSGLYFQCHVGFGDLLYDDGTWRPGGINKTFASKMNTERSSLPVPGFFRSGLAVGYQQILVDQYLTLNVMGGLQVQSDSEGYKGLWFFAPSFGIYF